jgi:DNA primase
MPLINQEFLAKIKQESDFIRIAEDYTKLKKAGQQYKGLSPFTTEKTPSFYVHPDKNIFKCFSTGTGGDIIRFIEIKESLSFQESVEFIAMKMGWEMQYVQLGKKITHTPKLRSKLLRLQELASHSFREAFMKPDNAALKYWTDRNLTERTAKEFYVGYAHISGADLVKRLRDIESFTDNELKKSGLLFADSGGKWICRFQNRLMIPIRNVQGQIIAFTGRILEDGTSKAKYINSSDSLIFKKGQMLFNLDKAKDEKSDSTVLVEGQIDAIAAWQAGKTNVVASQGTAITKDQLLKLRRFGNHLEVALDSGTAGETATEKLIPLALAKDFEVSIRHLPNREDPGSFFVKENALENWNTLELEPAFSYILNKNFPTTRPDPFSSQKVEIDKTFEVIASLPRDIEQYSYLQSLALHLEVTPEALNLDFRRKHAQLSDPNNELLSRLKNLEEIVLQKDNPFMGIPNDIAAEWLAQNFQIKEVEEAFTAFQKEDQTREKIKAKYLTEQGIPNPSTAKYLIFMSETNVEASIILTKIQNTQDGNED